MKLLLYVLGGCLLLLAGYLAGCTAVEFRGVWRDAAYVVASDVRTCQLRAENDANCPPWVAKSFRDHAVAWRGFLQASTLPESEWTDVIGRAIWLEHEPNSFSVCGLGGCKVNP